MTRFLKNDGVWRTVAVVLMTAIIGIGGWGLLEVTAMPKTYITKEDAQTQKEDLSKQICDLKEDISKNIDRLILGLHGRLGNMEDRINKKQEKTDKNLEKLQDLVLQHMINSNEDTQGDD